MKKLMFCAMILTFGAGVLQAEDAYLESSGGTGINSRYFFNPNTRFEVDYALLKNYTESVSGNGDWAVFSGYSTQSNNASTANYSVFNFYCNKGGSARSCGGDNWISLATAFPKPVDDKDIRRRVVLDAKNKTFVLTTAGFTNCTGTCAGFRDFDYRTAKIGAWYHGTSGFAPLKIYGCRIFEDDVLVRDLRPCVQNGLAGLKDEVDGDFLACGTYTYGGPIPHEQGDGYIESKTRTSRRVRGAWPKRRCRAPSSTLTGAAIFRLATRIPTTAGPVRRSA